MGQTQNAATAAIVAAIIATSAPPDLKSKPTNHQAGRRRSSTAKIPCKTASIAFNFIIENKKKMKKIFNASHANGIK